MVPRCDIHNSLSSTSSESSTVAKHVGEFNDSRIIMPLVDPSKEESYKRKGLCGTCGKVRTHKKRIFLARGKSKAQPITKAGEVYEGHCLKCNSLEDIMRQQVTLTEKQNTKDDSDRSRNGRKQSRGSKRRSSTGSINSDSIDSVLSSCFPRSIQAIINDMFTNPHDAALQARGCADLAIIATEQRSEMSIIRAIGAVVEAMNTHRGDVYVQEEGCTAIRRFSTAKVDDQENSHGTSSSLMCAGEDIHVNTEICSSIAVQGGTLAILSAMNTHRDSLHVQREGLRVLRNMLRALGDVKQTIVDNRGVEVIVRAMGDCNNKSATVQEDGCVILWSLAFGDRSTQLWIGRQNAVSVVLNAMRYYTKLEKIQYHGCGLLHILSLNEDGTNKILDCEGFDIIFSAIRKHGHSEVLVEKAFGALVNLAAKSERRCRRCFSDLVQDDRDAISTALLLHTTSHAIQRSGSFLLHVATQYA